VDPPGAARGRFDPLAGSTRQLAGQNDAQIEVVAPMQRRGSRMRLN
jgi:hypothetical protein